MSVVEMGTVDYFDDQKGFGFITRDAGGSAFVHFSDIAIPYHGRRTLKKGDAVRFIVVADPVGGAHRSPRATCVETV